MGTRRRREEEEEEIRRLRFGRFWGEKYEFLIDVFRLG